MMRDSTRPSCCGRHSILCGQILDSRISCVVSAFRNLKADKRQRDYGRIENQLSCSNLRVGAHDSEADGQVYPFLWPPTEASMRARRRGGAASRGSNL